MASLALWQWAAVFAVASGVLIRAGVALAAAADEIASRTRIGGLFVGSIFTASATSMPEVVIVVTAAAAGAPELAVGAVFGSSMANMAVLGVADLAGRQRLMATIGLAHARVASVAIALTALAVLGAASPEGLTVGWVGGDTLLIAVAYFAAVGWVRRSELLDRHRPSQPQRSAEPKFEERRGDIRRAVRRFLTASAAILIAGPIVAISGAGIADTSGLSDLLVGVLLVALASSLPELVTSLGAVRIGAFDIAVGNLFGSNAFNMLVLFVADVAFVEGPILTGSPPAQVVAGVGAIGLMAIALAVIVHGRETRVARLEPDAIVLLLAYVGVLAAVSAS